MSNLSNILNSLEIEQLNRLEELEKMVESELLEGKLSDNVTIRINVKKLQTPVDTTHFTDTIQDVSLALPEIREIPSVATLPNGERLEYECPICYNEVATNNSTTTLCGHKFHSSCLFKCVAKNINTCPSCRKHLFKRQLSMKELYNQVKDEIFNFETFCYLINMIDCNEINSCITDYKIYEDTDEHSDEDSDDEDEETLGFNLRKHETKIVGAIESCLENL